MNYLFVLGRNFELSRAELKNFCVEVFSSAEKSLFIGENLQFANPRNLPKAQEQIFLDRLGGTIRFGEIVGEFFSQKDCLAQIFKIIKDSSQADRIPKVGFTVLGGGKNLLGDIMGETKRHFQDQDKKIRIENFGGKNMTSGQIFDRRLLQKGNEFIVWKNGNSFLLARTLATQNLRNYTLRDRKKSFRDAKMGMLPPKLAQILINLALPPFNKNASLPPLGNGAGSDANDQRLTTNRCHEVTIFDPFCGSGTVNTEAAVMGFRTEGSDINSSFIAGAKNNFQEMSEKFRFPENAGSFDVQDATRIDWKNKSGVICTEGFLGTNFEKTPTRDEVEENARAILQIWKTIFSALKNSEISRVSLCLPCWNTREGKISISDKFFTKIKSSGFAPLNVFNGRPTFYYERDKTFVTREICVLERS